MSAFLGETYTMFRSSPVCVFPSDFSMMYAILVLHIEAHAEIFFPEQCDDIVILF